MIATVHVYLLCDSCFIASQKMVVPGIGLALLHQKVVVPRHRGMIGNYAYAYASLDKYRKTFFINGKKYYV